MFIDLDQKITRFVVQEYLNKIVEAKTSAEKSYDIHKLFHTLDVFKMAQQLIDVSKGALSSEQETQILNGAMLHDVARCFEYKDGKKLKGFDHGMAGAKIIQKQFPELSVEQKATELHNKLPSDNDPSDMKVVLDYVRDADMLGNIVYQVYHMDLFLGHIRGSYPQEDDQTYISSDIEACIQDRRIKSYPKDKKTPLLDMFLNQLLWIFALRTKAGLRLAKEQDLFVRFRDVIIRDVVSILNVSDPQKKDLAQDVLKAFPESLFEEEFQKYGV